MLLSYKKSDKANVLLNDLINIHNDRITCYEQALAHSKELHMDLKALFREIISEARQMNNELTGRVALQAAGKHGAANQTGRIYAAWTDLKVGIKGNSAIAIITYCSYHEEIALHAYQVALSASTEMSKNIQSVIMQHQSTLSHTSARVKKCREAYSYLPVGVMNFNGHRVLCPGLN